MTKVAIRRYMMAVFIMKPTRDASRALEKL